MTWPAADIDTTDSDAGTDNPQNARADILDLMQKFNQIRNHVSTFIQGLLDDADAPAARSTLGVTATGADTTYAFRANNLSDLANAGTARTNLGATATGSALFTATDAAAARSTLGLGTMALETAANYLRKDTEDQGPITGGATVTSKSITTGSFTVDCGDRPLQYITNGGAFTITAPAADGSVILLITNNASAGAITFSGFTVGSSVGDAFTTTDTHKFMVSIVRINGVSTYTVKALQ